MEWFAYEVGKKFWRDTTSEKKKAYGFKDAGTGAAENNADKNYEDLPQRQGLGSQARQQDTQNTRRGCRLHVLQWLSSAFDRQSDSNLGNVCNAGKVWTRNSPQNERKREFERQLYIWHA